MGPRNESSERRSIAGIVALALAIPNVAAAREPPGVLPLPLHVDGTLDAAPRAELGAAMLRGLSRAKAELVAAVDVPRDCDTPCRVDVAERAGAHTMVETTVAVADRNYTLAIRVYDGHTGALRAESTATCELCGTAEVATLLEDQLGALAAKLGPSTLPPPRVRVSSDPPGAAIAIDGEARGTTPATVVLTPGRHRVQLDKRGWATVARDIDLVAGVDEPLAVALTRQRRAAPIVGVVALALGLGLTGTGAGLLAIDGDPYRRRCSGDDVDFAGRCRFRYDTAVPGIVVTSLGVGLVVTGIVLLARRARRPR